MITENHKKLFQQARAMAEMGVASPTSAANYATQLHNTLLTIEPDIMGEDLPETIVIPESYPTVVLQSSGAHTDSDECRVTWPTSGRVIGFGVEVAEGPDYRSRVDFRLDVNGRAELIRKGGGNSGASGAFAPIACLAGQNRYGRNFLPVNWNVNTNEPWSLYFTSISALLDSGSVTLTIKPFFLFQKY